MGGRPVSCAHVRAPAGPSPELRAAWGLSARTGTHGPTRKATAGRAADSTVPARGPGDTLTVAGIPFASVREPQPSPLTSQRAEEVEKGIIGDLLGDCSDGASALMFLLFLDGFDGYVLSFLPVNGTPTGIRRWSPCAQQAGHSSVLHQKLDPSTCKRSLGAPRGGRGPGRRRAAQWPRRRSAGSCRPSHDYAWPAACHCCPFADPTAQDATTQAQGLKTTKRAGLDRESTPAIAKTDGQ